MYKLGMNLGTMYANAMKAVQDLQTQTLKLQRDTRAMDPNKMLKKITKMIQEIEDQEQNQNNMLTIKGIEKLFRQEIGEWRISGVETHPNTYIILLRKPNGEKHQINLERMPIGNEYEMWCWKDVQQFANMTPERLMLTKDMLRTREHAIARILLLMM